jgi:hypothetical protein
MADLRLVAAALAASLAFIGVRYAEAADAWTCTYPFIDVGGQSDAFFRFEVATPDLIETKAEPKLVIPTPQGTHAPGLAGVEHRSDFFAWAQGYLSGLNMMAIVGEPHSGSVAAVCEAVVEAAR